MILVIDVSSEKLYYHEFVRPILEICREAGFSTEYKHYLKIKKKDLERCTKAIICGTGILDNVALEDIRYFEWIRDFNKPILGICAGMEIIAKIFGCKIREGLDIGLRRIEFKKSFLGLKGWQEVYAIHSKRVIVNEEFEKEGIWNKGETSIIHCIKNKDKPFYGVLFHPEVKNRELILNFLKNTT